MFLSTSGIAVQKLNGVFARDKGNIGIESTQVKPRNPMPSKCFKWILDYAKFLNFF